MFIEEIDTYVEFLLIAIFNLKNKNFHPKIKYICQQNQNEIFGHIYPGQDILFC